MTMRKEAMFKSKESVAPPANLLATTVKREIDKKKHELKPLSPSDKMLVALRKVLVKMSADDETGSRYFISGSHLKMTKPPVATPVRDGEPSDYHGEGYARVGVTLRTGEMAYRFVHFTVSFRDAVTENGLPDIEFFQPTEIEDVGPGHPEVSGL